MRKTVIIRPTKFPFVFWAFNGAMNAKIDTQEKTLILEGVNTEFKYEMFGKWKFIFLKYFLVALIIPIVIRVNDFSLSPEKLIQYGFALAFTLSILLLKYNMRQFVLMILFALSVIVSFWTIDLWLTAYAIKYCIFFLLITILVIDLDYYAYSAKINERVAFNFLSLKKIEDLPEIEEAQNIEPEKKENK